jgi:hypothetical protein
MMCALRCAVFPRCECNLGRAQIQGEIEAEPGRRYSVRDDMAAMKVEPQSSQ